MFGINTLMHHVRAFSTRRMSFSSNTPTAMFLLHCLLLHSLCILGDTLCGFSLRFSFILLRILLLLMGWDLIFLVALMLLLLRCCMRRDLGQCLHVHVALIFSWFLLKMRQLLLIFDFFALRHVLVTRVVLGIYCEERFR